MKNIFLTYLCILLITTLATTAFALEVREFTLQKTSDPRAILCLAIFFLSYLAVIAEEKLHLRKSKPVILGATLMWLIMAMAAPDYGISHERIKEGLMHNLDEYSSLFLFLLVAMTYIATLTERNVFEALRCDMIRRGFSYRQLFWLTGGIAFFLSPIADNLTTALIMGSVIIAVGAGNPKFVTVSLVNVVVAANAGGVFSPFGDITTLMVWQSGIIGFFTFFKLFLPSLVTFLVPAAVMSFFLSSGSPEPVDEHVRIKRGGKRICGLFLVTIGLAVTGEILYGLAPFMGMMMGLSLLMFFMYYLRMTNPETEHDDLDIFSHISAAEWDTLLFFFGVILSVGILGYIGYLEIVSVIMYGDWGPTVANIAAGMISAVIDNIPVMFAILSMNPDMDAFQWLLITLTAGVGGSLLSVGSAAGVALMGIARGKYTFGSHLKWTPIILLGYFAGIGTHFLVNG